MVMMSNQGSQQKQINLGNQFSQLSKDPAIQQGLLGNWAFNIANQKGNGGRSYFESFANFFGQDNNGRPNNNAPFLKDWSDRMLSAYDSHVNTPNLEADILFQDTYMGGNNNKKQDIGWSLLG
jgi:hypothetical protein